MSEKITALVAEDNFVARRKIVELLDDALQVKVVAAVGSLPLALEYIGHQNQVHPRHQELYIPRLAVVLFDANLHDEETREGADARAIDQAVRTANTRLGGTPTLRVGISASPMSNFSVAPDADPGKHPYQIHLALAGLFPELIPKPD